MTSGYPRFFDEPIKFRFLDPEDGAHDPEPSEPPEKRSEDDDAD